MNVAPIILFCYKRPLHLIKTLNALKNNHLANQSKLYVFCDGAKLTATEGELNQIKEVQVICEHITGFLEVEVIKSPENIGLQNNVIKGLNYVLEKHEKTIVIEDDVETSPFFLQFMNDALIRYETNKNILSIGSWNYYHHTNVNFFNHMPDTIAWATWKSKWALFESDGKKLYNQLVEKKMMSKFNLGDRFDFEGMLKSQIEGVISSWAIRWTAVAVLNNTLTLYPKISLSKHIGFGKDSTNCESEDFNKDLVLVNENISDFDIEIKENIDSVNDFVEFENELKKISQTSNKEQTSLYIKIKSLIHKAAPTSIKHIIKKIITKEKSIDKKFGWFGGYVNWNDVSLKCKGYEDSVVFEKVKQATLAVRDGKALFERDSVLFYKEDYSFDFLNILARVSSENYNELNVLDFGGSLGSLYYQHKPLFQQYKAVNWNIIEQAHFVDFGKKELENTQLKFYYTIDECLGNSNKIDLIILSSVISYFEKPYELLELILKYNIRYLLIDKTIFINEPNDLLTLQVVPPNIYTASYPCWVLNKEHLINFIKTKYVLEKEYNPYGNIEVSIDDKSAYFKALFFKLL